jgi:hypothetical protein
MEGIDNVYGSVLKSLVIFFAKLYKLFALVCDIKVPVGWDISIFDHFPSYFFIAAKNHRLYCDSIVAV